MVYVCVCMCVYGECMCVYGVYGCVCVYIVSMCVNVCVYGCLCVCIVCMVSACVCMGGCVYCKSNISASIYMYKCVFYVVVDECRICFCSDF